MGVFPENLDLLHAGEEFLHSQSIKIIEANEDLLLHVSMIERCMDMHDYVRLHTTEMSDDQVVVALLGSSVFNSIASAMRLLLGGYYQSSGLQIRYIMESGWLLDYLGTEPSLVQKWKMIPEDERENVFKPSKIRTALDKRDGFTKMKRFEAYKRLCVLCGHPTFAGFTMLRPEMNGDAHMGPFLVQNLLESCIQELVQVSVTSTQSLLHFFPAKTALDRETYGEFDKTTRLWLNSVFGEHPDHGEAISDA